MQRPYVIRNRFWQSSLCCCKHNAWGPSATGPVVCAKWQNSLQLSNKSCKGSLDVFSGEKRPVLIYRLLPTLVNVWRLLSAAGGCLPPAVRDCPHEGGTLLCWSFAVTAGGHHMLPQADSR